MVTVSSPFAASAADIPALTPQHRACTRLRCHGGSGRASLDYWQQLVQLMPAVQQVTFWSVAGVVTEAMCESLRLMAVQPWARWLDIKLEEGMAEVSMERHKRVKQLVVFFCAAGIGTRVSSAVDGQQPCEEQLDHEQPTRPAGWKPPSRSVPPRESPSTAAALESGPSTTLPAKHSKRTKAEQAAEPTQPNKGKGKGKGKAAEAKPAPQPGM
ncbi:hypothetical protein QJQ45_010957 [Haematococcus lacustris]|nr:hypothetical protein QJQ45_010957 [Haematococcus lacustris]